MLGKHRLGIYEKALKPGDWAKTLSKARRLGFDFFEISVDESDERVQRLYWTASERTELKNAIHNEAVPVASMCLSAHRRFPLGSTDAQTVRKSIDIMKRAVDFSAEIGIRVIQLAAYDVYYEKSTPDTVKRYEDNLAKAAEIAEGSCVMLANEIMDTPFINSISKHLEYENIIKSPWLKVYPDVGNLTAWGNNVPAELIKGLGSIVQVHLKDTLPVTESFPGKFRDIDFGEGSVDFSSCFKTLEENAYCGPYLIEMWNKKDRDDMCDIARAKAYLTNIFNNSVGG